MRSWIIVCSLFILLCLSSLVRADDGVRVVLRDGRTFVGHMVNEDRQSLTVRVTTANITTDLDFTWRDVKELERGVTVPESSPVQSNSDPRAANPGPWEQPNRYIVLPMQGRIGIDPATLGVGVTAEGVRDALVRASRMGIRHIVFHIASDGGSVAEADEIAQVLIEHQDEFTYIAFVERALSAAMVPVLLSEHIVAVDSGAVAGAALSYAQGSSGTIEYDAKVNAAIAARFASWGETRGIPAPYVRAMVIPEISLWTWGDAHGNRHFSNHDEKPAATNATRLAGPGQIFAPTGRELVRHGIATGSCAKADEVGDLLGIPRWTQHGRYGEAAMRNAAQRIIDAERARRELVADCERDIRELISRANFVNSSVARARAADPSRHTDYYAQRGGQQWTESSRQRWQRRTDAAIREWRAIQSALNNIRRRDEALAKRIDDIRPAALYHLFVLQAELEHSKLSRERLEARTEASVSLDPEATLADRHIARLRRERNRTN